MNASVPGHLLERLADTLWRERHMVESLLFRMVTAKLLLAADEHRFVAVAMDEVEQVMSSLRDAEAERLMALVEVAEHLGVPIEDLTLAEIGRRAPEGMQVVFDDHRRAFLELTAEIEQTAHANRQLASSALGRLQRSLDALAGVDPASTYNAAGRADRTPAVPRQLDRAL